MNMVMCDFLMTMDVMLCTASIFNLCAISVDRYVCRLLQLEGPFLLSLYFNHCNHH